MRMVGDSTKKRGPPQISAAMENNNARVASIAPTMQTTQIPLQTHASMTKPSIPSPPRPNKLRPPLAEAFSCPTATPDQKRCKCNKQHEQRHHASPSAKPSVQNSTKQTLPRESKQGCGHRGGWASLTRWSQNQFKWLEVTNVCLF